MIKITAVICVRNEVKYLTTLFRYLKSEGVKLFVIDNGSTDDSPWLIAQQDRDFLVGSSYMPFSDEFNLTEQLAAKAEIMAGLDAEWVIHQDADEILQSSSSWGGLRSTIELANENDYNALNFDELVMLPQNPKVDDVINNNRMCYFFEPEPLRLMRAWKKSDELMNIHSGGHSVHGKELNLAPYRPILKHFIVRSQEHAYHKYLTRTFAAVDTSKGWHGNRIAMSKRKLKIPTRDSRLTMLASPRYTPNPLPHAATRHFWEW